MNKNLGSILFAAILVTFGAGAGWFAASQGTESAEPEEGGGTAAAELSDQTLKNLGVELGVAKLTPFVRRLRVQAVVEDTPRNAQPVTALLGGVVTRVHVRTGEIVAPGAPVVTLARAAIPRPRLELTRDIVAPVSEGLHASIAKLRTAGALLAIVQRELARVRKFTEPDGAGGLPVLPRKRLIELEYEVARADQEQKNAQGELAWHGLSPDEIETVRVGGAPPPNPRLWRRALEKHALWTAIEQKIYDLLPSKQKERPWSVAAVGELSAAGLSTAELAAAIEGDKTLARHFLQVASLLLEGHSLPHIILLAQAGALEAEMVLRAPDGDWDVARIDVRPGQKVESGASVALLHDARRMWLRLEPIGDEVGTVTDAFARGAVLRAVPLVAGSGPSLESLRVERMATRLGEGSRGAAGIVVTKNQAVAGPNKSTRTWRLRVGLRYLVEVPLSEPAPRYVLPASAVTDMGPERIVYVRDGKTFRSVPVLVEYLDDEIAVIADDGSLFEGDPVAFTGAFALGLALQQDSGAVDPHAGHNH